MYFFQEFDSIKHTIYFMERESIQAMNKSSKLVDMKNFITVNKQDIEIQTRKKRKFKLFYKM